MKSLVRYVLMFLLGLFVGYYAFMVRVDSVDKISTLSIKKAASLIDMSYSKVETDTMISALDDQLEDIKAIREIPLTNQVGFPLLFNPIVDPSSLPSKQSKNVFDLPRSVQRPENDVDLAFMTVAELSVLIKTKQLSSVELTQFFLARLKKYDSQLHAVVSFTEERALKQAKKMDDELAKGIYRGPLHGIPYGAKDLLSVKGTKTTWGATPFKDQIIDETATVVQKLDDAGAVLIAKLTLGALAYGDIWYADTTRNPWNLSQGSSGSSAGSASATSAGLVPFAIGTETLGSIVSPSTRCGVSGLRPTFGRVSKYGAMALSWSMDKIGPIARFVEDLALIFDAIHGPDNLDLSVQDIPYNYNATTPLSNLKIAYVKSAFERESRTKVQDSLVLVQLKELGADLIPIELPEFPASNLTTMLVAEGAAAFDDLTRSGKDDEMVWQAPWAWPNLFRAARFFPAVEYINAGRARMVLMKEMHTLLKDIDVYVCPSFANGNLSITNLTGHPAVVVPNGFIGDNQPTSITFMANIFEEGKALRVASAYQKASGHHTKRPPLFAENN